MSHKFDFEQYLAMSPHNPIFVRDQSYVLSMLNKYRDNQLIEHDVYRRLYEQIESHGNVVDDYVGKAYRMFDDITHNGFDRLNFDKPSFKGLMLARAYCWNYASWLNSYKPVLNGRPVLEYLFKLARDFREAANESGNESKWDLLAELRVSLITAMIQGVITNTAVENVIKVLNAGMVMYYRVWEHYPRQSDNDGTGDMNLFGAGEGEATDTSTLSLGRTYALKVISEFLLGNDTLDTVYTRIYNELYALKQENNWTNEDFEVERKVFMAITSLPSYKTQSRYVLLEFARMFNKHGVKAVYIYSKDHLYEALNYATRFSRVFTNESLIQEMVVGIINDPMRGLVERSNRADSMPRLISNLEMLRDHQIINPQEFEEYLEKGRVALK